ncbi:hypothetical protein HDU96_002958 [Phlyctochytrium bullatum]|nr:hypothetical protein HDU96_002958 [Phlyctochytrium bullatum]
MVVLPSPHSKSLAAVAVAGGTVVVEVVILDVVANASMVVVLVVLTELTRVDVVVVETTVEEDVAVDDVRDEAEAVPELVPDVVEVPPNDVVVAEKLVDVTPLPVVDPPTVVVVASPPPASPVSVTSESSTKNCRSNLPAAVAWAAAAPPVAVRVGVAEAAREIWLRTAAFLVRNWEKRRSW